MSSTTSSPLALREFLGRCNVIRTRRLGDIRSHKAFTYLHNLSCLIRLLVKCKEPRVCLRPGNICDVIIVRTVPLCRFKHSPSSQYKLQLAPGACPAFHCHYTQLLQDILYLTVSRSAIVPAKSMIRLSPFHSYVLLLGWLRRSVLATRALSADNEIPGENP